MNSAEEDAKLEKKLTLHLGGYQKRQKMLKDKVSDASDALDKAKVALSGFKTLAINEDTAINRRLVSLRDEVNFISRRERGTGGIPKGQRGTRSSTGGEHQRIPLIRETQ